MAMETDLITGELFLKLLKIMDVSRFTAELDSPIFGKSKRNYEFREDVPRLSKEVSDSKYKVIVWDYNLCTWAMINLKEVVLVNLGSLELTADDLSTFSHNMNDDCHKPKENSQKQIKNIFQEDILKIKSSVKPEYGKGL